MKLLTEAQLREIYKDFNTASPEEKELIFQKVKEEHDKLNSI